MNEAISTAGRVCLCEWSGPVSVTMVVSLLSTLKQLANTKGGSLVLLLYLDPLSAKGITKSARAFIDVFPALSAYCQEVVLVCHDDAGTLGQLRRALCGSQAAYLGAPSRPLSFFGLLDDAFTHVQHVFPHDALELRRRRLRNSAYPTTTTRDTTTEQ
jgi:hypothetical protein